MHALRLMTLNTVDRSCLYNNLSNKNLKEKNSNYVTYKPLPFKRQFILVDVCLKALLFARKALLEIFRK